MPALRRLVALIATSCCLALLTGCISFTTAQTGRTLKAGETAGFAGLMYVTESSEEEDDEDEAAGGGVETSLTKQKSYGFVAGARYGLTGDFDIGARASNIGFAMMEAKYQLLSSKTFAMAVGFGLGLSSVTYDSETKSESGDSESSTESEHRISEVPLFMSFDASESLSLYGALRYVYIHSEQDQLSLGDGGDDDNEVSSGRVIGLTTGVMVKSKPGFFGELSYYMSPDKDVDMTGLQVAAGLAFNQP